MNNEYIYHVEKYKQLNLEQEGGSWFSFGSSGPNYSDSLIFLFKSMDEEVQDPETVKKNKNIVTQLSVMLEKGKQSLLEKNNKRVSDVKKLVSETETKLNSLKQRFKNSNDENEKTDIDVEIKPLEIKLKGHKKSLEKAQKKLENMNKEYSESLSKIPDVSKTLKENLTKRHLTVQQLSRNDILKRLYDGLNKQDNENLKFNLDDFNTKRKELIKKNITDNYEGIIMNEDVKIRIMEIVFKGFESIELSGNIRNQKYFKNFVDLYGDLFVVNDSSIENKIKAMIREYGFDVEDNKKIKSCMECISRSETHREGYRYLLNFLQRADKIKSNELKSILKTYYNSLFTGFQKEKNNSQEYLEPKIF